MSIVMFEQLGAKGWRKQEPVFIPEEKPRAFRKTAELLYGNPINHEKLATDAHVGAPLVREVLQAHAGAVASSEPPKRDRGKILSFGPRSART